MGSVVWLFVLNVGLLFLYLYNCAEASFEHSAKRTHPAMGSGARKSVRHKANEATPLHDKLSQSSSGNQDPWAKHEFQVKPTGAGWSPPILR